MKSKPILFSQPMVKAILDGRKNQTRRIIKPQPPTQFSNFGDAIAFVTDKTLNHTIHCPYGKPGDILWVRETFFAYGYWSIDCNGKKSFNDCTISEQKKYHYNDDPPQNNDSHSIMKWHKRPSLFMPHHASRINLLIKSILVERLQYISEDDAKTEGIQEFTKDGIVLKYGVDGWEWSTMPKNAKDAFSILWKLINGPESWNENPWVWVVEFEKI